jgi:hypothetical protein
MKKLLFVLALVAVYAVSVTQATAGVTVSGKSKVTIVADDNKVAKDDTKKPEVKKEGECAGKKVEGCCAGKTEESGCPMSKQAGGCPHAKAAGTEKEPVPAQKK